MPYSPEDSGPDLDQVGLKNDQTFIRYLASLDRADEHVVCSQQAQVLQVSYETGPENSIRQSESVIVCLTNYRLLLFPQLIDGSLICNALDMFLLEDVIMVSLSYRCINDAAFRTEDVALHLVSLGTLWLRMKSRSDFAECLCQSYHNIVHTELAVQQVDYEELIKQICSGAFHRDLVERRRWIWAMQPLLMTSPMLYQSLESLAPNLVDLSKFSIRFLALSRHVLHVFISKAEIEAYRFILSKSPSERAQLPSWVEIDLNDCLMSTFRLESDVNRDGIQIQCPNGTLHLFMPLLEDPDPLQTLNQWVSAIRDRDLYFVNRIRGDLENKPVTQARMIPVQQEPIEVSLDKNQISESVVEVIPKAEVTASQTNTDYDDLQEVVLDDDPEYAKS